MIFNKINLIQQDNLLKNLKIAFKNLKSDPIVNYKD